MIERPCSKCHSAVPSRPLPTPSAWVGWEVAFPGQPELSRESQPFLGEEEKQV